MKGLSTKNLRIIEFARQAPNRSRRKSTAYGKRRGTSQQRLHPFVKAIAPLLLLPGLGLAQQPASVQSIEAQPISPAAADSAYSASTLHTTTIAQGSPRPVEIVELSRALGGNRLSDAEYISNVYEYVKKNIKTEFRYGLSKGARGALLDESGTPFDQAELMVELLEQGGVSATYKTGHISLSSSQFGSWTGLVHSLDEPTQTFSVEAESACQFLANGGIPATVNGSSAANCAISGAAATIVMSHIWVQANGMAYDPSLKESKLSNGIDLSTALGCGSDVNSTCGSQAVSAALPSSSLGYDALVGADFAENLATNALNSTLNGLAISLQHEIESIDRYMPVEAVVGGSEPKTDQSLAPAANLPYSIQNERTWSGAIPDQYRTRISLSTAGNEYQIFLDEVYGDQIRIFSDYVGAPLKINISRSRRSDRSEVELLSVVANNASTAEAITIAIDHPYLMASGTYGDESVVRATGWKPGPGPGIPANSYVVLQTGETGESHIAHALRLATEKNSFRGTAKYSFFTYSMAVAWAGHSSQALRLINGINRTKSQHHHTIGLSGNTTTGNIYIDAESVFSVASSENRPLSARSASRSFALVTAALESRAVRDDADTWDSGSSLSWFELGNENSLRFYNLASGSVANFFTHRATNFDSSVEQPLVQSYFSAGYDGLIVPSNGDVGSFSQGSATYSIFGAPVFAFDLATGNYAYTTTFGGKGAVGGTPSDPREVTLGTLEASQSDELFEYGVDKTTGTLTFSPRPDLVTGMGEFPYSLSFQRHYSSVMDGAMVPEVSDDLYQVLRDRPTSVLRNGWSHGFEISANIAGSPMQALGQDSALDASLAIAALTVLRDLNDSPQFEDRLTGIFVGAWMSSQMEANSINVTTPPNATQFLKLPDGSYNPPPGVSHRVTQIGDRTRGWFANYIGYNYTGISIQVELNDGSTMYFSQTGTTQGIEACGNAGCGPFPVTSTQWRPTFKIDSWDFPYGVTVSFDYDLANPGYAVTGSETGTTQHVLKTVRNNLGRRLDFSYQTETQSYFQYPLVESLTVNDESNREVYVYVNDHSYYGTSDDRYHVVLPTGDRLYYEYESPLADQYSAGSAEKRLARVYMPSNPDLPYLTINYDSLQRVSSVVDREGNEEFYFVARMGNERASRSEFIDRVGSREVSYANSESMPFLTIDPRGFETTFDYDNANRVVRETFPEGNRIEYSYDIRSNQVSVRNFSKDGLSEIVATSHYPEPDQFFCANPSTCNQPSQLVDGRGNATDYRYYPNGLVEWVDQPLVDGVRPRATYAFNGFGQLTGTTDPTGIRTCYSYDSTNKHTLRTITESCQSGGLQLVTTIGSDSVGNVTSVDGPRSDVLDVTTYDWDSARRLISTWTPDPDGAGPQSSMVTVQLYSEDGYPYRTEQRLGSPTGTLLAVTERGFDERGLLRFTYNEECFDTSGIRSTGLAGCGITETTYDAAGRTDVVIDAVGRKTKTIYDLAGQVERVVRAYGTTQTYEGGGTLEQDYQTYTYTQNGQVETVKDANGNLTTYRYDGQDRLEFVEFPHKTSIGTSDPTDYEQYSYDANGNREWKRTRAGDYIVSTFDALNREKTKEDRVGSLGGPVENAITYTYDAAGRQKTVVQSDGYSIVYEYDGAGRIDYVTDNGRVINFDYDANGNRIRIDYPGADGFYVTYEYDHADRIKSIKEKGSLSLATYSYDDRWRRNQVALGNGRVIDVGFYDDGLLQTIQHNDLLGLGKDATWSLGYSAANQITSKTTPANFLWQPQSAGTDDYGVNGLNQYDAINGQVISYDGNGSLTDDGVWVYDYDVENRLISAVGPGVSANYEYDPLGRRARKSGSGVATEVYLNDGVEEIADYDGSGTLLRRYVHGLGIDERLVMYTGTTLSSREFYHTDHQRSTVAMSTSDGSLQDTYSYGAFGETGLEGTAGNPFRYTGRRIDPETGLYYYRARYYTPALGRFLQTDPIGYADNMNMYAYVGNDPANLIDPTGTQRWNGFGEGAGILWAVNHYKKKLSKTTDLDQRVKIAQTYIATLEAYGYPPEHARDDVITYERSNRPMTRRASGDIKFSQTDMNRYFSTGETVDSVIQKLSSGEMSPDDLPPIRVFTNENGDLVSLDNRRLFAAQEAGVEVNTVPAAPSEVKIETKRKNVANDKIRVRKNSKPKMYKSPFDRFRPRPLRR